MSRNKSSPDAALVERERFFVELLQFEESYVQLLDSFLQIFVAAFRPMPGRQQLIPPFDFQTIFMVGLTTSPAASNKLPSLNATKLNGQPSRVSSAASNNVTTAVSSRLSMAVLRLTEQKSLFEELRDLHDEFFKQLRDAKSREGGGRSNAIGQCFTILDKWYHPYATYFGALDATIKKVVALKANARGTPDSEFHVAIQKCEEAFHVKTGKLLFLENALRIPFDHVSKYADLLKRLTQLTNDIYCSDARILDLYCATEHVKNFLTFANDYSGEVSSIQETILLQRAIFSLPPEIDLLRQGRLRNEGQLRVGKSSARILSAFLFDKMLLLCSNDMSAAVVAAANKRASQTLAFFMAFDLSDWSVESPDDPNGKQWAMGWSFVHNQRSEPTVDVYALDARARVDWITWILRAHTAINPRASGNHKLVYVSFMCQNASGALSKCKICSKYIANYGYVCQYCDLRTHVTCKERIGTETGGRFCPIGADISQSANAANHEAPLWWGGVLGGKEAAACLKQRESGTFMIRYSNKEAAFRVSSIFNACVRHLVVETCADKLRFASGPVAANHYGSKTSNVEPASKNWQEFLSVVELAEWFMENSASTQIPFNRLV